MTSARLTRRDGFKPKLIALSVAACFSVSATQSSANPTGGTVASGSASFAASGSTLTITNSANAIINWQSFSIGVNEITRFLQSSGSSAVLNRVVGANGVIPQSVIDGILSSNGRVFLLNSSGIAIGANARIDVAGFVASSLNLSDADFLAGRMRFTETPGAGKVSNAGLIDTTSGGPGGRVFLVGPDVQNSGVIRTPQGEIILAAGKSVELVSESSPFVTVNLTADSEQALNVGQLLADSGRIGMFGALVRQGGVAQANSAVVGANGEIRLVATKDLTLDAGSLTTANGPSGGNVTLQAQGGTNLISGTVEAKGSAGQGGTIEALGVRVGVIGNGIIDASGEAGGGTVLVGGDAHGANPNIQNADRTFIGSDGVIRADAGTTGDGGRVIVWADGDTRFYGSVSAQGGAQSGNGGFVETSGKLGLDIGGHVNAGAPNGQGGTWLLDPTDVSIVSGPNGLYGVIGDVSTFAAPITYGGRVTVGTLQNQFSLGPTTNVYIQATNSVGFYADLSLAYSGLTPKLFEVRAGNNIDLAADAIAHTITTNGHNVTLSANDTTVGPVPQLNTTGTGAILGNGNIVTGGGAANLSGASISIGKVDTTSVSTAPGAVNMTTNSGNLTAGPISAYAVNPGFAGGTVTLTSGSGNMTTNGTIDVHGANGTTIASNGSTGGTVNMVRSSTTAPGSVTVNGDIIASGGAALAAGVSAYAGGTGGAVRISSGVTSFGASSYGVYGSVLVAGNIFATGGNAGAVTSATGATGGAGGAGGSILLAATNTLQVGAATSNLVDVSGGNGGAGAPGQSTTAVIPGGIGGAGGTGGSIFLIGGQQITNGTGGLTTVSGGQVTLNSATKANAGSGGVGGSGTLGVRGGNGGAGGNGGTIGVLGGIGANIFGPMAANGGAGGNGGLYGGAGGGAGFGGTVSINSAALSLQAGINADGGSGGYGGASAGSVYGGAAGGNGGSGGTIDIGPIDLTAGTVDIGSGSLAVTVSARGGSGGAGGSGDPTVLGGTGGASGGGGFITVGDTLAYGQGVSAINAFGTITADDGAGGNGGAYGGSGGNASGFGEIDVFGSSITLGTVSAIGGTGGAGGAGGAVGGNGGGGGGGGFVQVTATGAVTIGAINVSSGNGGNGADGAATNGYGGNGGSVSAFSPGFVQVNGASINIGSINAYGGRGGNGGATTALNGTGGYGGDGGEGGFVTLTGPLNVTTGAINISGGDGGNGGDSALGFGGHGGAAGNNVSFASSVSIDPAAGSIGPITGLGGNGGAGGYGGIAGGYGGAGGYGATVAIDAVTQSGSIAIGNIDVSGGAGGSGGGSGGTNAYGGAGGAGGYGGTVTAIAYGLDLTQGGTFALAGGAGGAGGATSTAGYGGSGGAGGYGGTLDLASVTASGAYGSILVASALSISVAGGTGGAGGATGGIAGLAGLSGSSVVFGDLSNSGTSSNLDANTVIQGTNQLVLTNTAPSADELRKKEEENKKKNQVAACK